MKLFYQGKTKDVYTLPGGDFLLKFKDDATGENGVFDPGANAVGLSIAGLGRAGLAVTLHFFRLLEVAGIPTHILSSDIEKAEMTVRPAEFFGKGLEVICRFRAVGSFLRRYGAYAHEGQKLDALVEITLKDDARQDPPISKDALVQLGIMTNEEYDDLHTLTRQISTIIADELVKNGLELYDIKLEFGKINGNITLIDEISPGNMRVYRAGEQLGPMELANLLT